MWSKSTRDNPGLDEAKGMTHNTEFDAFNEAMTTILLADPKAVKEAMEREKRENAELRKAKGERKRGRKPKAKPIASSSARVSPAKD